jgi:hypothetical protein
MPLVQSEVMQTSGGPPRRFALTENSMISAAGSVITTEESEI